MNNAYLRGKKLLCGGYSQFTPNGKGYFVKQGRYSKIPKPGSPIYFYYPKKGRVAHVEIVVSVAYNASTGKYHIKTVGGNTSGDSATRNGGQVAIHEFIFSVSEVGGGNRIDGFGEPIFDRRTAPLEIFLAVVMGEVGYLEKASNKDLHHKTANAGFNNYTKYGEWYGGNGLYWCQQFVSWCAYEACRRYLEQQKTGWEKDGEAWKYRLNGEIVKGKWQSIGGRWYVFDESGAAIKGWFKSEDGWYYLNPEDCAMLSGQWLDVDGKTYYLAKSGVMAVNAYVKSSKRSEYYWINEKGEYDSRWNTHNPSLDKYELVE